MSLDVWIEFHLYCWTIVLICSSNILVYFSFTVKQRSSKLFQKSHIPHNLLTTSLTTLLQLLSYCEDFWNSPISLTDPSHNVANYSPRTNKVSIFTTPTEVSLELHKLNVFFYNFIKFITQEITIFNYNKHHLNLKLDMSLDLLLSKER